MGRKKSTGKKIIYPGYFHLHKPLLESEDFISLKGNSLKLLIDIGRQYNGYNNGQLVASMSYLRKYGWNSNQQLTKALKELIERNLIQQTRQGGFNIGPNYYALTWQNVDKCSRLLDVSPTITPLRSFK